MYVGTSSPRCKSFKSNVGLLFLNEMLHPVIVALQIGRLDGEISFKKWVILAAWCPSPPFFRVQTRAVRRYQDVLSKLSGISTAHLPKKEEE